MLIEINMKPEETKKMPVRKVVTFGKREVEIFRKSAHLVGLDSLAALCGVSQRCLLAVLDRQPEFKQMIAQQRADTDAKVMAAMLEAIEEGKISGKQLIEATALYKSFIDGTPGRLHV